MATSSQGFMRDEAGIPPTCWDGSIVRPSKIPGEFKLVMTQEMKDYQKILRETMFEHHRSH